jgi:hypothetical protein
MKELLLCINSEIFSIHKNILYINENKKVFQNPSIIKLHIPNELFYYFILNKNLTIFF